MPKGILYLIPTTLGDSDLNTTIPAGHAQLIESIRHFVVEEERTAKKYFRKLNIKTNFSEMSFYTLNEHTHQTEIGTIGKPLQAGETMAIISEAGCPAIADPGALLVEFAHKIGAAVIPLVGPSSILLALIASGFNGQNFAFNGYLPIKTPERIRSIKDLEYKAFHNKQTQIFMETPYRNMKMLADVLSTCNPNTKLCIAADITLSTQYIKTQSIAEWKASALPDIHKRPAIFLLQV